MPDDPELLPVDDDLDPEGMFRDAAGPLWHRDFCQQNGKETAHALEAALKSCGATHMIVGHTRTDAVGGVVGKAISRFSGRLIMTDIGLGEAGDPGGAIVVERNKIEFWAPGGSRTTLSKIRKR